MIMGTTAPNAAISLIYLVLLNLPTFQVTNHHLLWYSRDGAESIRALTKLASVSYARARKGSIVRICSPWPTACGYHQPCREHPAKARTLPGTQCVWCVLCMERHDRDTRIENSTCNSITTQTCASGVSSPACIQLKLIAHSFGATRDSARRTLP